MRVTLPSLPSAMPKKLAFLCQVPALIIGLIDGVSKGTHRQKSSGGNDMQLQGYEYAYHDAPPSECPTDGWKRLRIHELVEVHAIIKKLVAEMKRLGYPRKDTFAAGLLLHESVTNAIRHGNRGDKTRTVAINYHVIPEEVLIEVTDEGFGFNPYLVTNPLAEVPDNGRVRHWGLFLMRVYASWVRFNRRGNQITLCKRHSAK
jgi:serine/threonine-protein kinase RsbW